MSTIEQLGDIKQLLRLLADELEAWGPKNTRLISWTVKVGIIRKAANELESLQKACAENKLLLEIMLPWSYQAGHGLHERIKQSLSTDCGKDYVHISGQEKLANELDRVEDEYTKQLEAAQQRIEKLENALTSIRSYSPAAGPGNYWAIVADIATEALENEKASNTPAAP